MTQFDSAFKPALRDDLVRRDIGHESVIWSPSRPHPAALDTIATVMLNVIDGAATTAELAEDVRDVIGIDEELATARVSQVVAQLDRAGALTTSQTLTRPERQRELFVNPPST